MPLTDRSDVFASIGEDAINRVFRHVMRQNPHLFNYATPLFENNPGLLPAPIDHAPGASPLVTRLLPYPIPNSTPPKLLEYCFQVPTGKIDFHPESVFTIPNPPGPLNPQEMALKATVRGGLELEPGSSVIEDFQLDLFVKLGLELQTDATGAQLVAARHNATEIVDVQPPGLETIIEAILTLVVRFTVIPKMKVDVSKFGFDIGSLARIELVLTPSVTPNPAIEDDKLNIFLDARV